MTLTQAAAMFRLGVKIGGITFGTLILLRSGVFIYDLLFPQIPPPPAETPYTGQIEIPPIELEIVSVEFTPNYQTILDILTSGLPTEPKVAPIFPVLKAPYGFLSEDRAQEVANVFGLMNEPIKLNATESLWNGINKTLNVNTQNLNFGYRYKYELDQSVFQQGIFTSQSSLSDFAIDLKSQYNIYGEFADDLSATNPKVFLLKYLNGKLQPVQSINEASAARIDFIRNPVSFTIADRDATFQFVSPSYVGSVAYTLLGVAEDRRNPRAIEVNHVLWRYDSAAGETYPMISSQVAWESIQQNPNLFTVYVGNLELGPMDRNISTPVISSIRIKKVYFAYYNFEIEQDYVQPVWVFEGKAQLSSGGELDWIGYVPALEPRWIKTQQDPTAP